MITAGPDPASKSREAYARCLKDFVAASLDKKLEATAFDAALASACRDKETLFKTTLVSSEVAIGIKRAVAEKGMDGEIADYRSMAKEDYRASLTTAAKP